MNTKQLIIGVAVLVVGTLVYLIDRSPDQTYFIYSGIVDISFYSAGHHAFGRAGCNLPSFFHVVSFILLTAGLFSLRTKGYIIVCVSWMVVDCAFELGQKYSALPLRIIPEWFTGIPFLENTKSYFLHGTFDFLDLAAIALGSILAYSILLRTPKRRFE